MDRLHPAEIVQSYAETDLIWSLSEVVNRAIMTSCALKYSKAPTAHSQFEYSLKHLDLAWLSESDWNKINSKRWL